MTLLMSFYPRTDSPGVGPSPVVVLSQDRRTPRESFYPRTERLPWSRSILGQNDSPGVVISQDIMTPLESFYPKTE